MVKVSVVVPPVRIGLVPKSLVMLGGLRTVREAAALPVEPLFVPPFVELTNPLMFWYEPEAVPVMATLTVQELLAGIVPPAGEPNVRVVFPAAGDQVGLPPQVVAAEGVAATCRPEGKISLNVTSVRLTEFELDRVKVSVEVPLMAMEVGENFFVIAGGAGVAQPLKVTLSMKISEPEASLPALKK